MTLIILIEREYILTHGVTALTKLQLYIITLTSVHLVNKYMYNIFWVNQHCIGRQAPKEWVFQYVEVSVLVCQPWIHKEGWGQFVMKWGSTVSANLEARYSDKSYWFSFHCNYSKQIWWASNLAHTVHWYAILSIHCQHGEFYWLHS